MCDSPGSSFTLAVVINDNGVYCFFVEGTYERKFAVKK